jgi:hypothetical protein
MEEILMEKRFNDTTYSLDDKLVVLDDNLRVIDGSPAFYKAFDLRAADTIHQHLSEIDGGKWNVPALLAELNELAPDDGKFHDFELHSQFPIVRTFLLKARRLANNKGDGMGTILLAIYDLAGQPSEEAALQQQPLPLISAIDTPNI